MYYGLRYCIFWLWGMIAGTAVPKNRITDIAVEEAVSNKCFKYNIIFIILIMRFLYKNTIHKNNYYYNYA